MRRMDAIGARGARRAMAASASIAMAFVAQAVLAPGSALAATAPAFSATDLGSAPYGACCWSNRAINSDNPLQILGGAYNGSGDHAVIWQGGGFTDLGLMSPPSGYAQGRYSDGYAINAAGDVAGVAELAATGYNTDRAFLWKNGTMTNLGDPNPDYGNCSNAHGLNDSDTVVGEISVRGSCDPFPAQWPSGGGATQLPTLTCGGAPGGPCHGEALAINNNGEIAGWSGTHAVVWNNAQLVDLGRLSDTAQNTQAVAINDSGVAVGWGDTWYYGSAHAFIWQNGVMTDLNPIIASTIAGTNTVESSQATSINSHGDVVGYWTNQWGNQIAFLYSGGVMYDLTSLLPAGSTWGLNTATAINDSGYITGYGKPNRYDVNAGTTAYLLKPAVTVNDTDLGITGAPADITVDATSSSGATVTYTAPTATDESGDSPAPSVSCDHASGTTFAIGTTTVTCTATDSDDSPSSATAKFNVSVKGALAQLNDLLAYVNGLGPGTSLPDKVQTAINYYPASGTADPCSELTAIVNEAKAQSGKKLTVTQANTIIEDANRIRAVIGC